MDEFQNSCIPLAWIRLSRFGGSMHYFFDRFANEIYAAIQQSGQIPADLIDLQTPKSKVPADLALHCFRPAKALGSDPATLARQMAETLQFAEDSAVGKVEAIGPFLNFSLRPERLASEVLAECLMSSYGTDDEGADKTVVIDYSSPNVAKRMHVGHIRSTIIGQSLVNIYRALGYTVIGDNHMGDLGTGFGRLLYAIERWGWPQGEGEAILAELEELYQRANAAEAEDPGIGDAARAWSLKLERGDAQAMQFWKQVIELTLRANQRNYARLGVSFDHSYGESFYTEMMPAVIDEALRTQVAHLDEGEAVVVAELEQNLPSFLLRRSDGGSLYHTRDVATIIFRQREFHPHKIIYVVEQKQELHFRQLFALVRALGHAHDIELVHIYFGTIFDAKGQPLSTRRGNMIYLESLLDEAIARARKVVEQKNSSLTESEKDEIAQVVGVGAVIYNDLYQDLKRNITLDWDRMLSTEGNSATYLQYSYARCRSILRRAQQELGGTIDPAATGYDATLLIDAAEQQLLRRLAGLPHAVREAATRYAPYVIADWCYGTARDFATFYDRNAVLKADTPALRNARLALVAATAQALKNGLALLGVRVVEQM
jgi:arginyl-tRNA synthetase